MRKKNNKGFTLVELIIVIAIVAILAAIFAPNFIKYLEEAEETKDLQIATELVNAAMVAVVNPDNNVPSDAIIEVLWGTGYDETSPFHKWILVRDASYGSRVSALRPTTGSYTTDKLGNATELQEDFFTSLGYEMTKNPGTQDWYAVVEGGESVIARENNFAFHISPATGEVALAHGDDGDSIKNIWIDEMGVNITPIP